MAALKPVYLLSGSDRPKVDLALERLRARFAGDAIETLDATDSSAEDAVAACNAMGLFGAAGRLVVVDRVDAWKAPDAKAIAEYAAAPAPDTVLALLGAAVKADGPLGKAVAKHGDVLVYDVDRKGLPRWIAERFARAEAQVEPEVPRLLLELVGEDPHELANEVDKLVTWAAGETIGTRDVELLVVPRAETPLYVLTDAWGSREVARALAVCESLLERESDQRGLLARTVGLLANHLTRLRQCQQLDAEGVRPKDAAGRLKLHPFRAQKLFEQARNFSPEELDDATVKLARLDLALKGKSRLPGELELERTLVDITRGAGEPARG